MRGAGDDLASKPVVELLKVALPGSPVTAALGNVGAADVDERFRFACSSRFRVCSHVRAGLVECGFWMRALYCAALVKSQPVLCQTWDRRHVFEDVPPYVCESDDCNSAEHTDSRRWDWQHHCWKSHFRRWFCPFRCAGEFRLESDCASHLATLHPHILDTAVRKRLTDSCAEWLEP